MLATEAGQAMAWAVVELAKLPRSPSRLLGIRARGRAERLGEDLTLLMAARSHRRTQMDQAQPITDDLGIAAITIALRVLAEG